MHLGLLAMRWFLVVLLIGVAIAGSLLYSTLIHSRSFPATIAYYQYTGPDSCLEEYCNRWARLNHTIIVRNNHLENFLTLTVLEELWPGPKNVIINISFDSGGEPVVVKGDTRWTGELHQNDSLTVHTSLTLPSDGTYFIWANPYSSDPTTGDGLGLVSVYQIQVKDGRTVGVSNASFENPGTPLRRRCLSNCWPWGLMPISDEKFYEPILSPAECSNPPITA